MQEPGVRVGEEVDGKMVEDFMSRPRNRLSGVRYSGIGQQSDEIDIAEELLGCIRELPLLLKFKDKMFEEHDKMIVNVSDAPDESLQPVMNVIFENTNVIEAIFDLNNKYDEIEFIFNCIFALLPYVTDNDFINNINKLSKILSQQSKEFTQINVKLYVTFILIITLQFTNYDHNVLRSAILY